MAGSAPALLRSMAGNSPNGKMQERLGPRAPEPEGACQADPGRLGDTTQWSATLTQVLSQLAEGARQDSTSSLCQLDCDSYSDVVTSIMLSKALAGLSLGRSPLRAMGKGPGGGGPAVTAS